MRVLWKILFIFITVQSKVVVLMAYCHRFPFGVYLSKKISSWEEIYLDTCKLFLSYGYLVSAQHGTFLSHQMKTQSWFLFIALLCFASWNISSHSDSQSTLLQHCRTLVSVCEPVQCMTLGSPLFRPQFCHLIRWSPRPLAVLTPSDTGPLLSPYLVFLGFASHLLFYLLIILLIKIQPHNICRNRCWI